MFSRRFISELHSTFLEIWAATFKSARQIATKEL